MEGKAGSDYTSHKRGAGIRQDTDGRLLPRQYGFFGSGKFLHGADAVLQRLHPPEPEYGFG